MASSSKIKGITIEIGGNTTKLENALKDVNKVIYGTNNELKELNRALKLDPKNTELLAQKQELLKSNIEATTNKLKTLKSAQEQMGSYSKLTDAQKESYRALSVEISKSETALKGMQKELKATGSINLSGLVNGLKNVGEIAGQVLKKVTQVATTVGTALTAVVSAGVKSYADLEQNIGGVETLFGKSANKVIKNAEQAYKTAGVSANEYMQGVTSFSASLLQSLGGDTEKAADIADMAFRDMADNANKFGTSMDSIQSAYQGFAKGQYQLLDNLKLGYGGTKTEMQRLLKDAQKFSGVKYDINNLNDVYEAIHVIQQEMGVTGTTAKESSETISGSVGSMKAALSNFLNGSGSPEDLADSMITAFNNIAKTVQKIAPKILNGIVDIAKKILPTIIKVLNDNLPMLMTAALQLMQDLLDTISQNTQPLIDMINSLVNNIVTFITNNLPTIFKIGLDILLSLINGISQNLDKIIPAITECILTMVQTLVDNIDLVIEAGFKLIVGLAKGLVLAIPKIIEKIPEIIKSLATGFAKLAADIVSIGKEILDWLIDGLLTIGTKLADAAKQIWEEFKKSLQRYFGGLGSYVSDLIKGKTTAEIPLTVGGEFNNNPTGTSKTSNNQVTLEIGTFVNNTSSDINTIAEDIGYLVRNAAFGKGGR